jgi:hypothetical protein
VPGVTPTVKDAEAESPAGLPVAVIVYTPVATLAITKEAVRVPAEIVQVEVVTTLPANEQLVSLDENPEPDTKTIPPVGAEDGLNVIDGVAAVVVILLLVEVVVVTAVTVRVAEAKSPVDPITVIVYTPATTLATTKEAVNVPPETVQV